MKDWGVMKNDKETFVILELLLWLITRPAMSMDESEIHMK